jgi:lipopolysaccharide/colanic/teichoic acid biosynthesis glycosyltransferase
MATRPIDLAAAAVALVPAASVCLLAAAGIWLTDGAPVLYRSRRVGMDGRVFTMYKLRTMRQAAARGGGRITGGHDPRVFVFGSWLRRWKVDELPQLLNVLRGDMAIVGPRPEDPDIVDRFYDTLARETLRVRPGLASPGSIYNFTHGERALGSHLVPARGSGAGEDHKADGEADVETAYVRDLLPRKLALDLVYVRGASTWYDLRIVLRAALCIVEHGLGRRAFPDPPEMPRARAIEQRLAKLT